MSFAVNNVGKLTLEWYDSQASAKFLNVLHYRGHEGTWTDAELDALVEALAMGPMVTAMLANLIDSTCLTKITFQKIAPAPEFAHEAFFAINAYPGTMGASTMFAPQAAACIVRKSFLPGRKGIGRIFFGPLSAIYNNVGGLVVDPVGGGDLTDVLTTTQDPITGGGKEMRPIVCASTGLAVTSNNDIRVQTFSQQISFVHSRKRGIGM